MKRNVILIGIFLLVLVMVFPVNAAIKACTACNSTCNTLPGMNGTNGTSATITVNYTGTLAPGNPASVTNIGDSTNAIFDFFIPKGDAGAKGDTGNTGSPGTAATIAVNYTFNLAPGTSPTFVNIGTATAAIFDVGIPRGYNGTDGSAGDTTQYVFINGTRAMTGKFQMGGYNISNILDPVVAQDAATKNYVDAVNTSMRNNISIYSVSTATLTAVNDSMRNNVSQYVIAVNDSMRNNISIYSVSTATLTAVNDSMRNNVSQYVIAVNNTQNVNTSLINSTMNLNVSQYMIAVNNTQNVNISLVNASMRNNVSAYVIAVNDSMRNNVSINHATLVSGKVPTAQLGGAGADNTKFLRGDQSWVAPGAGAGYGGVYQFMALTSSPADNGITYFGALPKAPAAAANQNKIYFTKAGTVKYGNVYSYSGTAGSAETWGMYLLLNGSTEYAFGNLTLATNERVWFCQTFNIGVGNGSYFEIKSRQPAWGTNPLTTIYGGSIIVE